MDDNVFDTLYKEGELNNFEIVESFTYTPLLTQLEESCFHDHKEGIILYQPNLTYFPVSNNGKYGPNDFHI